MISDFLDILKEEENRLLSLKTNWGRNELKMILAEAKANAMARIMDERC
jgi:hypothetical protein